MVCTSQGVTNAGMVEDSASPKTLELRHGAEVFLVGAARLVEERMK